MGSFKVVMDSMTEEELANPRIIGKERTERIARGSGQPEERVRELLEQYNAMRQMLEQFQGMGDADMERMMKQMQQGGGGGGMGGMGGGMGPFGD
jgi:signal recognition particle subunit SRP54